MALPRFLSLLDLGVATVVAVAIFLPAREMYASNAIKGDEQTLFAVPHAEAKTLARPDDGVAVKELAERLGEADLKDWAVEAAVRGSERAKDSPTRWHALLAASAAYAEQMEVVPALDYANRALASCETTREKGDTAACPSAAELRMRLYQQHLEAGVKSGIDPKVDAAGFRAAAQRALMQIYIGPQYSRPIDRGSAGGGAGSAGSAAAPSTP